MSAICFVALRYTSPESPYSDSAAKFLSNVANLRSISAHFKPKIDAWTAANEVNSITPTQVSLNNSTIMLVFMNNLMS